MHAPYYRRVLTTFKATITWVINGHVLNNAHFIIYHIEHDQVPMYVVMSILFSIDILFLLHRYDWWLHEIFWLFNYSRTWPAGEPNYK